MERRWQPDGHGGDDRQIAGDPGGQQRGEPAKAPDESLDAEQSSKGKHRGSEDDDLEAPHERDSTSGTAGICPHVCPQKILASSYLALRWPTAPPSSGTS